MIPLNHYIVEDIKPYDESVIVGIESPSSVGRIVSEEMEGVIILFPTSAIFKVEQYELVSKKDVIAIL